MTAEADPTDEALVEAAKEDRHAFARLYRRYADLVYRFCYRRLQSQEMAEDVASTVFERALAALPRFTPRSSGSFRSWLFTIAHHTIVNTLRDQRVAHPLAEASTIVDPGLSPEETVQVAETRTDTWQLIASLPPLQQRVLELRLADLTGREIADVLGISHGAVKAAQFRAIARLRETVGVTTPDQETLS